MSAAAGRPTWHRYVATMECFLQRSQMNGEVIGGPGWEHIYECEVTRSQRRYGLEDRKANKFDLEEGN